MVAVLFCSERKERNRVKLTCALCNVEYHDDGDNETYLVIDGKCWEFCSAKCLIKWVKQLKEE
jgi:peptide subunit release factor 1 (eRF1)